MIGMIYIWFMTFISTVTLFFVHLLGGTQNDNQSLTYTCILYLYINGGDTLGIETLMALCIHEFKLKYFSLSKEGIQDRIKNKMNF